MHRAVALVLFVTTALADKGSVESVCNKLGTNLTRCCNNRPEWPGKESELKETDVSECYEKEKLSPDSSCYIQECFAKLAGYYGSDGKLDKDGFEKHIKKLLENDMDFFFVFKEKCMNTDISKYGPPDMCDYIKMEKCSEWSDDGECKGMKDIIQNCKAE